MTTEVKKKNESLESDLVEKYEKLLEELRKDAPKREHYITVIVYDDEKMIDKVPLKQYELHTKLLPEKYRSVLRSQFPQALQECGYGVQLKVDEESIAKRTKKVHEQVNKLMLHFRDDLMKKYNVDKSKIDNYWAFCTLMQKDGGLYFIEEALEELLKIVN